MNTPDLMLFAKQPIPGKVKTRLLGEYSAERAADIAAFALRASVVLAASNWPGEVYLYAWPDSDHPLFHALAEEYHIHLATQAEGELGAKMLSALRDGIARSGSAAVMGTDVPHCPSFILEQAYEDLARGRNVIGPAVDGGYYLIGLNRAEPALFAGIHWGGSDVLAQTLARARAVDMEFEPLPELRDIDRPEDLRSVAADYVPLRRLQ